MSRAGYTVLITPLASLEDAHETVGRLTQAGFARNSIDVERRGDDRVEVVLHLRERNLARAHQAIGNRRGAGLGLSDGTLLLIGGGLAALGAGLYALRASKASPARWSPAPDGRSDRPSRPGVMGDGTEEQSLNQPGNPGARISEQEVRDAFERNPAFKLDES